jgi:predicted phosphodiesterase
MRIALFSDVHGNLSALEAVRQDIDKRTDLDRVIFAGDLCLFGPRPEACLLQLRDMAIPAIAGNTDEWIRQPPPLPDDMPEAQRPARQTLQELCRWTEGQLSDESLAWLDDLRDSFQIRLTPTSDPDHDLLIVHANPHNLLDIIFPSLERQMALYGKVRQTDEDLAPMLQSVPTNTIAFGHLHIPGVRLWGEKKLINVSSVSLPGDGDKRAKYAILSWQATAGWHVEHVYVAFDVQGEIGAFRRAKPPGWPERVAQLETLGYIPQVV